MAKLSHLWLTLALTGALSFSGATLSGCTTGDDDDSSNPGDDDATGDDDDDDATGDDDDDDATGDDDDDDATGDDDDDTPANPAKSTFELNQVPPADGTVVTTRGIVTGIDVEGNFWIQDAKGGKYSGMFIYDIYEQMGEAARIRLGDEVEVTGEFKTYFGVREMVLTLASGSVRILTPEKGLPEPLEVADFGSVSAGEVCTSTTQALSEPYMNVLIRLPDATVLQGYGACELDPKFKTWKVSDASGDELLVSSSIELEYTPVVDSVVQLSGIFFYSFNAYKLVPTEITEVTPGPQEGPIYQINKTPESYKNTTVTVTGRVTGIDYDGNFWVEDAAGGLYSGIFIYDKNHKKGITAGIVAGDEVEVTGYFTVFEDLREITLNKVTDTVKILKKNAGLPPPVLVIDLDPIEASNPCGPDVDASVDAYMGVLLRLPNVTVSAGAGACGTNTTFNIWEVQDPSGDRLLIDDAIDYAYVPTVGNVLDLTGIYTYNFDQYKLNPIGDAGIVIR